jgi:hypothetical protein
MHNWNEIGGRELIVSTVCICVRQVNWCMIDNWNKIGGLRIYSSYNICLCETSKLMYDR